MNGASATPPGGWRRGAGGTGGDSARMAIMQAAAGQFATRAYSEVSLDDILRDAHVTKGAMYFHFRSKYALALAIVDAHNERTQAALADIVARGLSGLETIIDVAFHVAVLESTSDDARAGMHLLESIGRTGGLVEKIWSDWVAAFGMLVRRATEEGDVVAGGEPEDVARLLVAMYAGVRQLTDLSQPRELIRNLESAWWLLLPGIASADRSPYLRQFVRRRSHLAGRDVAADG